MAEFVKKTDGENVKLKVRRTAKLGGEHVPEGLVAYIKNFKTSYDDLGAGHLIVLELFVSDIDLERASGFAPHIYNGGKIRITLVKDGVPISNEDGVPISSDGTVKVPIPGPSTTPADPDDEDDSEPSSEGENDDNYEEDTEGPPPVIPPTSEPGATEEEYEKDKQYDAKRADTAETIAQKMARLSSFKKFLGDLGNG
jgi:hypothetical protein